MKKILTLAHLCEQGVGRRWGRWHVLIIIVRSYHSNYCDTLSRMWGSGKSVIRENQKWKIRILDFMKGVDLTQEEISAIILATKDQASITRSWRSSTISPNKISTSTTPAMKELSQSDLSTNNNKIQCNLISTWIKWICNSGISRIHSFKYRNDPTIQIANNLIE